LTFFPLLEFLFFSISFVVTKLEGFLSALRCSPCLHGAV
jgi:hypothetical protein